MLSLSRKRLGRICNGYSSSLSTAYSHMRVQTLDSNIMARRSFSTEHEKLEKDPDAWIPKWLLKEHITADKTFNRWKIPPASMSVHLAIGSVYAWSLFNAPLTREVGVIAQSSMDWGLSDVVPVFSTAIVFLGLSAAMGGHWLERVGPRMVGMCSALCWGGGILTAGAAISIHSLPLLYLGYGVLGGIGLGLGYVSPVSTLIRWFPDRRGMATGMAIMGFGGGAMVAAPLNQFLLARFAKPPKFMGPAEDWHIVTEEGRRLVELVPGEWHEVVVASASDVASSSLISEVGVYLVGTGNTGAASTFFVLGSVYTAMMMAGALAYRVPPKGYDDYVLGKQETVTGKTSSSPAEKLRSENPMITKNNVHIDTSLKTPQFYLLWTNLFCNVTAGIGVIGVAKTMITDIFGSTLPTIVDGGFAATYVLMISVFNMTGRFFWASISDYIGRKNTYFLFFGAGIPLYLSIPYSAQWVSASPEMAPLILFYASTMTIFTMYGGGFATIPAFLADMFGTKYVGGIHGRLLTAWSAAGIAGPMLITKLRENSLHKALSELAGKVDPDVFHTTFGAPLSQLDKLIETKAVTIPRMLEICSSSVIDPTPALYNDPMYAMAGVLCIAFVSNALIRPVDPKYHMSADEVPVDKMPDNVPMADEESKDTRKKTIPNHVPIIYINTVFRTVTPMQVKTVIQNLNFGEVAMVEVLGRTPDREYWSARVHMKCWYDNKSAQKGQKRLLQGESIKIIYDKPYFWYLTAYIRKGEKKYKRKRRLRHGNFTEDAK